MRTRRWGRMATAAGLVTVFVSSFLASSFLAQAAGAGEQPAGSRAEDGSPRAERVLIVSLPYVSWTFVHRLQEKGDLPNLTELFRQSGLAVLSTRAPSLVPDITGGYVTLGAGDKAVGAKGGAATTSDGAAFPVDGQVGDEAAGEVYRRRTGRDPGQGIVHLGIPEILIANSESIFDAPVGRFGDALAEAGYSRAVIANGDGTEPPLVPPIYRRSAVAALMGSNGKLPGGVVDRSILREDPRAPFGLRLDLDAVSEAFTDAWQERSVVLVEASDIVRANEYLDLSTDSRDLAIMRQSLRWTDELVGRLMEEVDPARDAVVVIGPATNQDERTLTITAMRAPGTKPGFLRSPTTQREGFVQLIDIAPSVLKMLDIKRPESMRGRPIEFEESDDTLAERRAELVEVDAVTNFRGDVLYTVAYLWFGALGLLAFAVALMLSGVWAERLRRLIPTAACALIAYVPVVFLARLLPFHDYGVVPYVLFLLGASTALGVAFQALGRADPLDPLIIGLTATVGLLVIDVVLGSNLLFNSGFGSSPEVAGRFIGFGNIGYAALGAAAVLLAGLVARRVGGRNGAWVGIGILAVALVADGAPFWGADVGGVLSMVPAFGLTALLLLGIPITKKNIAAALGLTVVAAAFVTVLDLLRPVAQRTHLGRLVEQIQDEGFSAFSKVIERKLHMNFESVAHSHWRVMVLLGALFVAYLWFRGPRALRPLVAREPEIRTALLGFAILAVLGYALNDSGVLVPGVMLGILTAVLAFLLVALPEVAPSTASGTAAPRAGRARAAQPRSRRS